MDGCGCWSCVLSICVSRFLLFIHGLCCCGFVVVLAAVHVVDSSMVESMSSLIRVVMEVAVFSIESDAASLLIQVLGCCVSVIVFFLAFVVD